MMDEQRARMLASVLPPALELAGAFLTADRPEQYWQTAQRILADTGTGPDPATASAQLIFGLSALVGILVDQIADATGRQPSDVMADLHTTFLTA